MPLTKSLLLLLQGVPEQAPNHCKAVLYRLQHTFKLYCLCASISWSLKLVLQAAMGGPRHSAGLTPPPRHRVLAFFCSGSVKKRWVYAYFQKTSIWTPLYLSFSLVFFLSVTGAETRPDSRGLRHSADPFGSGTRFSLDN